jgi:hypothetical protein
MRAGALLLSRTDVDLRVLEVPPVAGKDLEGLIGLRLRSVYPGNPRETVFDYRLVRCRGIRKALVFVARKATVDAYRAAAGRRQLVLPYQLIADRVPRRGPFRAWFCQEGWAELLAFLDGVLVSSTVKRTARGRPFDLAAEEGRLAPELRAGPLAVVAPERDLARMAKIEGASYLPLEPLLGRCRRIHGLFPSTRWRAAIPAGVRTGLLAVAVVVLGMLVLFREVRRSEDRSRRLAAIVDALEQGSRTSLAEQKELDTLLAERERLDALLPRDLYGLLSELAVVIGDTARVRSISVRGDGFQLDATGSDPFVLMEGFKARGVFSELKLSQVVPDQDARRERFSISGTYHGR